MIFFIIWGLLGVMGSLLYLIERHDDKQLNNEGKIVFLTMSLFGLITLSTAILVRYNKRFNNWLDK